MFEPSRVKFVDIVSVRFKYQKRQVQYIVPCLVLTISFHLVFFLCKILSLSVSLCLSSGLLSRLARRLPPTTCLLDCFAFTTFLIISLSYIKYIYIYSYVCWSGCSVSDPDLDLVIAFPLGELQSHWRAAVVWLVYAFWRPSVFIAIALLFRLFFSVLWRFLLLLVAGPHHLSLISDHDLNHHQS